MTLTAQVDPTAACVYRELKMSNRKTGATVVDLRLAMNDPVKVRFHFPPQDVLAKELRANRVGRPSDAKDIEKYFQAPMFATIRYRRALRDSAERKKLEGEIGKVNWEALARVDAEMTKKLKPLVEKTIRGE